jgi:hypothetical protein
MEEEMSRAIARRLAAVLSALVVVWQVTSAKPANAIFEARNIALGDRTLRDSLGRLFTLNSDACPYYQDNQSNLKWRLWSPIYYFTMNETNNSVPIAFGVLRNESTGTIWDGGFGMTPGSLPSYSNIANLIPQATVAMSCPPS